MAESYGFFDGNNYYGEEEFNRYFKELFRSGVSIDDSGLMTLAVSQQSNTSFRIGAGFAILDGYYYVNTTNIDKTITRASSGAEKNSRIFLTLDRTEKEIYLNVRSSELSSWAATLAPVRDSSEYEIALARVNDKNGTVTLIDERWDQDLCGTIRPKNLTELNEMLASMQNQFENWFEDQQSTGWREIYIQADAPSGPVSGSIWIERGTAV